MRPWLKDIIDESISPNWVLQILPLRHGRGPFFCLLLAFKDHSFLVFHTCLWVIWQLGAPSAWFCWWYALPLNIQTKQGAQCLEGNSLLFWTNKGKTKTWFIWAKGTCFQINFHYVYSKNLEHHHLCWLMETIKYSCNWFLLWSDQTDRDLRWSWPRCLSLSFSLSALLQSICFQLWEILPLRTDSNALFVHPFTSHGILRRDPWTGLTSLLLGPSWG